MLSEGGGFRFDGRAAAILYIGLITILAGMAVSPALAGIKSAFPELDDTTIQAVLTVPALCVVPGCLVCDSLVSRIGSRSTLMIGLVLYLVGGVAAGLMSDFHLMLMFRAVLGIGVGILTPLAQILISENYTDRVRDMLVGIPASASFLMGFICATVVGNVAAVDWHLAFAVYLIALPEVFLVILFLPSGPLVERASVHGSWSPWNGRAWILVASLFLTNIAFYTFSTSVALFMRSEGMGGDEISGYAVSVFMFTGFVCGLVSSRIRRWLGRSTFPIALALMSSGFVIMSLSEGLPGVMCAGALIGGSYLLVYSRMFAGIREVSKDAFDEKTWISIMTAGMFGGQAVSALVVSVVTGIIGISGYRGTFLMLAVMLIAGAAISIMCRIAADRTGHTVRNWF